MNGCRIAVLTKHFRTKGIHWPKANGVWAKELKSLMNGVDDIAPELLVAAPHGCPLTVFNQERLAENLLNELLVHSKSLFN